MTPIEMVRRLLVDGLPEYDTHIRAAQEAMEMSTASALLDDGARTLAESRRAVDRATRLQQQTRELLIAYRSHRFRVISGSNDLSDAGRHSVLRVLASESTRTFVGLSRGAACMLCGSRIKSDELEYQIEAVSLAVTLDFGCYRLFSEEKERATSRDCEPHC